MNEALAVGISAVDEIETTYPTKAAVKAAH